MEVKTIKKPWGEEIWFAHTDQYAGKILKIFKGHRMSLQYHDIKRETQYIKSGKVKFTYGETLENLKEIVLNPGDKFEVIPKLIHRVEALEESEIIEVSTPQLDDIVKIEDDYGRTGSGNNFDLDLELHKQSNKN